MEMCVLLHWDYILQSMARNRKDGNGFKLEKEKRQLS